MANTTNSSYKVSSKKKPGPSAIKYRIQPKPIEPVQVLPPVLDKQLTISEMKNRMMNLCAKHNYDPIRELMQILADSKGALKMEVLDLAEEIKDESIKQRLQDLAKRIPTPDMRDMLSIHRELLQYLAPKLKATEVDAHVDGEIRVIIQRFSETGE